MKESEVIRAVAELLSTPESWIKNIRALKPLPGNSPQRDTYDGRYWPIETTPTNPTDPEANQFCLGGAVMRVLSEEYWDWGNGICTNRFNRLACERGFFNDYHPFVEFNNAEETTHEDMVLFLKEALYEAEAEEAQAAITANLAAADAAGGDV